MKLFILGDIMDYTSCKKVLACFSGGGFRQMEVAAGVIQAIEQKNINITNYMGASAGAIISALHSSKLTGNDLEQIFRTYTASKLMSKKLLPTLIPFMKSSYIYERSGMENLLKKYLIPSYIKQNVLVSATEEITKKSVMMDGSLESIMASSAIPEVFAPVTINKINYVDGGVKNNIPVPKVIDLKKWDLVIIVLCCDSNTNDDYYSSWFKLTRAVEWFEATMDREFNQIYESLDGIDNVKIIKPLTPDFNTSLLDWSENYKLINWSKQHTLEIL